MPYSIFLDIDGVLLPHPPLTSQTCTLCTLPLLGSRANTTLESSPYPVCESCCLKNEIGFEDHFTFPKRCLEALNRLLFTLQPHNLILSSTWRCDSSALDNIIQQFSEFKTNNTNILSSIEDIPLTTNKEYHYIRQQEIHACVKDQNLNYDDIVIIDDDESCWTDEMFKPVLGERCVKCDSQKGLEMSTVVEFIERINKS